MPALWVDKWHHVHADLPGSARALRALLLTAGTGLKLVCRAEAELQKLAQRQASRQAQQQGSDRLHALNRKAALENRARAHAAKKPAAGVASRAGEPVHDPYARKATKVVQYWSTGRKEGAQQASALKTEEQQRRVRTFSLQRSTATLALQTLSLCASQRLPPRTTGCSVAVARVWLVVQSMRRDARQHGTAIRAGAAQVKLSAVEELAGLEVTTSSHCEHSDNILARRLLGPQYTFATSHRVDSVGKKVISLQQYQQMVKVQHLRSLGLG